MQNFRRILIWLSSLRVAIFLLLAIAIASGIGTIIPQNDLTQTYIENYQEHPLWGFISGESILLLQLNQVYTSSWFLTLLGWLGFALIVCSWRRQWPTLLSSLNWIDYKEKKQIRKLAIAKTIVVSESDNWLNQLSIKLKKRGWKVQESSGRLAARKGGIGRVGPLLVHMGLIILMIGAVWGALAGQKIEEFLIPGKSIELISQNSEKELIITLEDFSIERDPSGRPEQFKSKVSLISSNNIENKLTEEISVNHPLRYKGLTIYQADWKLSAITLQIGNNKNITLPLTNFPELGDQIWGLVLPTKVDMTEPILISVSNENGPVKVFNKEGQSIGSIRPGGPSESINDIPLKVIRVSKSSGILVKKDPGVPLVYFGFAISLIGGLLSIVDTKKLWALSEGEKGSIHIGCLCNRNLSGLAFELPRLIEEVSNNK